MNTYNVSIPADDKPDRRRTVVVHANSFRTEGPALIFLDAMGRSVHVFAHWIYCKRIVEQT